MKNLIALCSTRDPPAVREAWLKSLGDLPGPGTILRTSGTSSQPKNVYHTLDAHIANARAVIADADLKPGDKWALILPTYHVGGLSIIVRCMLAGADVAMSIDEAGVTHVSLVATQLARMLKDPAQLKKLYRMKRIYVGGGPVPESLFKQGLPIVSTYGSTEMASQIATCQGILPDRDVKILDGEICVKGPMLMTGYVRNGQIDPARDEEGWFHTGDIGKISDNRLEFLGRLDNMMISGGENIHPEEIERVLLEHESVQEAVVVARPHVEFGERPIAFIKVNNRKINAEALRAYLYEKLAKFKVPDEFLPWPDDVPTGTVKLPRAWFKEK